MCERTRRETSPTVTGDAATGALVAPLRMVTLSLAKAGMNTRLVTVFTHTLRGLLPVVTVVTSVSVAPSMTATRSAPRSAT